MTYEVLFQAATPAFYLQAATRDDFDDQYREIKDAYADEDVTVVRLRGAKCRTRQGFFDEAGAVLDLPAYFGETWDALDDSVENLGWMPGTLVVVTDADQLLADASESDFGYFVSLARKCNEFYLKPPYKAAEASDTGFHVLLQVEPGGEAALEARLAAAGADVARFEPGA